MTLHLFLPQGKNPFASFILNPESNKTGWVWHILVEGIDAKQIEYSYQVFGDNTDPRNLFNPNKILSDPYARGLNTTSTWGDKDWGDKRYKPRGKVILPSPFDWEQILPPKLPLEDLVIYEMHVRFFTINPSSQSAAPGTFKAMIEKIPYLKSLGVNAVELLPIFEFNECENHRLSPVTHQPLKNVWGYSTINFFAPMNRYSSSTEWTGAIDEFRSLVKELHRNGIEVYLDVVYNHTAEGNQKGPFFSFKGIDNQVYYMLNPQGDYLNFSGTGNTFNANHPVVATFIVDSLRYWVEEMGVDGFRFDLASCLTRDEQGVPSSNPLVIQMMTEDAVLADVKMIAEAWDAAGLYQVGSFPGKGRWMEWNGKYRDTVRRFIKGTDNQSGEFAKALCGSQDLYGHNKRPFHSINFIIAHDGFTLRDLVTYQNRHNLDNGEKNHDGCQNNESWNCGAEGETQDPQILALRKRQMCNFHVALMISIGTPMIFMGDEYAHTKRGNNNTYCQDNALNEFLWDELKTHAEWARFYRLMIGFRNQNPLLRRKEFFHEKEIFWHGLMPMKANWGAENRFISYTLQDPLNHEPLYIAFNSQNTQALIHLPCAPKGRHWYRIVDTSLVSPLDFVEAPMEQPALGATYTLPAHTSFIAKAL